jgi:hypothetical protein
MTDQLGKAHTARLPQRAFALTKVAKPETDEPTAITAADLTESGGVAPVATPPAPVETSAPAKAPAKKRTTTPKKKTDLAPAAPKSDDTDVEPGRADAGVPITLRESVYDRLIAYKKASGKTHPTILFDAIEATHDRMPDLIKSHTIQPETSLGLFDRPKATAPRQDVPEPKNTFIIRVSHKNKAVIDDLVTQFGAPNQTQYTAIAYEAYLEDK